MKSTISLFVFVIYIVINVLFVVITSSTDSSQLKLVFMIHRHGDRTPIQSYPTDPYANSSYWPDGWGQLTTKGKQRMYALGEYIRRRYQDFLTIDPREVYIRSSGSDRCLESAALVMAGMYRPDDRWIWDNQLGKQWQPFAIQTVPHDNDSMLNPGSHCVSAEQELSRIRGSSQYISITQKKKGLLDYVSINSGRNVTDLDSAEKIFDVIAIEQQNGYKLPLWIDTPTFDALKDISDITFVLDFSTHLIQRLRTGLLLKDVINRAKEEISKNKNNTHSYNSIKKKIFIYSTHDTQLATLMNALHNFDNKSPPFGSTILIELRQSNSNYTFNFYYMNDTYSKPIPLGLPNCTDHQNECSFTQFVESVNDLIPDDWDHECHNTHTSCESTTVMAYLFGSLMTLAVIAILYIIFIIFRRKPNQIAYHMLPNKAVIN
ncbi:prostatic acid phosphatase-like [Oppia nitens]|uniref:prostatic acid phosphatase-like n=1 Tax=Oppia nitens TaxID=1686743 RepID=UPI0023D9C851|nr:prostatic acid phosphatase-like [Oppia nitens]